MNTKQTKLIKNKYLLKINRMIRQVKSIYSMYQFNLKENKKIQIYYKGNKI